MYDNGEDVAKNYTEAAKWYRKAAEKGHGLVCRPWQTSAAGLSCSRPIAFRSKITARSVKIVLQ
jgi:hypothetical protein